MHSANDKMANFLTLHSLVTPAPLHRRRNSPQTILTTIHPSLRAWLAPLIYPRLRTPSNPHHHEREDLMDRQSLSPPPRPHGANSLALNRYNLDQHLQQLLLAAYDGDDSEETELYGPRERAAVDVLQDSARVAHHVAGLLADYESQRKFPPDPPPTRRTPSIYPIPGHTQTHTHTQDKTLWRLYIAIHKPTRACPLFARKNKDVVLDIFS